MADDLDLSEAVIRRALAQIAPPHAPQTPRPSSPREAPAGLMGILGAAADGASTYALLKKGYAEDNAAFGPLKGHPAATGLAAAGTGLAGVGLAKLLGKKWPKVGEALSANYAAQAIGIAGKNAEQMQQGAFGKSSVDDYRDAVLRGMRAR